MGYESGDNRAFLSQPTYGDNVYALRLKEANTKVIGFDPAIATLIGGTTGTHPFTPARWGIGGSARPKTGRTGICHRGGRGSEWHRGNLVSPDFRIDKPVLSCLVSGGNSADLRVELQLKQADGAYSTLASVTGSGNDVMVRIKWVVPASANGGLARYKIVDNSVTGHINADDFRSGERLPADPAPVWGFVDTHAHPMVHLAFGSIDPNSSIIWGSPGQLEDANRWSSCARATVCFITTWADSPRSSLTMFCV